MKDGEHQLQCAIFTWMKLQRQRYPELHLAFAIPNGGNRDVRTAKRLKDEGVRAGVLDIFIPVPRGDYHGMWVEVKFGNNKLTKEQDAFMREMALQGYYAYWGANFEKITGIIEWYMNLRT